MNTFILSALGFAFTVFVIAVLLNNMMDYLVYDAVEEDMNDAWFDE